MEITAWIILLNLTFLLVNGHYQNANYEHWMRQVPRRPVEVMTDVINSLGINILQQYHVPGNVAFSPTGLGFVLTALYEGSSGRGSKQIAEAMQLPHDRQITRIGLRDIHRRLRSYLNADGFLGGLNLNKDNTRLRPEFEDILRFYGFDFTIDSSQMNGTGSMNVNNTGNSTLGAGDTNTTQTDMNGMTTMTPDGSTNQQGGNNTMDASTLAGAAATTTASTVSGTVVTTTVSTAASVAATTVATTDTAATTMPPTVTTPPMTSGGLSSTTPMNTPTTIDTSVDLITVSPNNSAPIVQSMNSSTSGMNLSTTAQISGTSSVTTDPPGRFTSTASGSGVSGSGESGSEGSGVSGPGVFNPGIPGPGASPEATVPLSTPQFSSEGGTQSETSGEFDSSAGPVSKMDITTSVPRSIPAVRSSSFGPLPVTLRSRPSLSTLRLTTSDRFQTSSRILDTLSTMRKPRMSTSTRLFPLTTPLRASTNDMHTSTTSDFRFTLTSDVSNNTATNVDSLMTTDLNSIKTTDANSVKTTDVGSIQTIDVNSAQPTDINTVTIPDVSSVTITNVNTIPTTEKFKTTDVSRATTEQPNFTNINVPTMRNIDNFSDFAKTEESTNVNTDIPTTEIPSTTLDGSGVTSTVESPTSNSVRKRRSAEHYFSTYPDDGIWMQHLNIWRPPQAADEATVRDSKQVAFLVNGCDVATVSAATYTAVLPFAYFPSLKAVAVEFPLDNPRYNVILFLPTERPDTLRLAIDLGSKSLRLLRKHLQPTWIRATIPSFMLKGFVTLTPYLQRLGIRDVFEPRAADLSPMTPDIGVYARDVQQSIGVNIRNYMEPDRTSSSESSQQEFPLIVPPRRDAYRFLYPGNGLLERAGPVSFVAEHPFLYFIIDTETTATLIAGRIDDPLNSRIL